MALCGSEESDPVPGRSDPDGTLRLVLGRVVRWFLVTHLQEDLLQDDVRRSKSSVWRQNQLSVLA